MFIKNTVKRKHAGGRDSAAGSSAVKRRTDIVRETKRSSQRHTELKTVRTGDAREGRRIARLIRHRGGCHGVVKVARKTAHSGYRNEGKRAARER